MLKSERLPGVFGREHVETALGGLCGNWDEFGSCGVPCV